MAMYFDESISHSTLRKHFEAAKKNGVRYVGIMQQILDDPYAVTCDQSIITAHACEDIVRQVREQGLRPRAPKTTLFRLLDTRGEFNAQADMVALDSLAANFTPDAKDAYFRYLDARAERAAEKGRGLLARLFKR